MKETCQPDGLADVDDLVHYQTSPSISSRSVSVRAKVRTHFAARNCWAVWSD